MRWFNALRSGAELASRLYRQVDKAATSLICNTSPKAMDGLGEGRSFEGFFETAEEFCRQSSGLPRFVRGKGGAGD